MKPAVCHILSAAGAAARGDVVYRLDLLLFVVAADLLVVHLQPEIFPFLAAVLEALSDAAEKRIADRIYHNADDVLFLGQFIKNPIE